jgi:hypothetical protein|tara:strand:+ start:526 stop:876 length:351 start_codon:yes stop_codon:yes gene_type:complete
MAYNHKGHYGEYSGNAKHSKHHMVNSWEEEDVSRGRKEMAEGNKGHAEALFDDAHGSYNYDGDNSTGAEHYGAAKKVSWKYGDGTYSGELIPSKETSTHRYARTENGKIKSLPKNK